jgi:hypothetical protein
MNNNCWYSLNIDFSNALRKDWVWQIPDLNRFFVQCVNPLILFNPEWLNYMKSIEVPINYVMLLYKSSNNNSSIAHVDLKSEKPLSYVHYAMNWIIEGQDSEMTWYNLPEESSNVNYNAAPNIPIQDWPISTLTEIDRANIINSFTLVRTDVPHNVVNKNSRLALSVRSAQSQLNWQDSVDHFRSKNLLIER